MSPVFAPDEPCDLWERLRKVVPDDRINTICELLERTLETTGYGEVTIVMSDSRVVGIEVTTKYHFLNGGRTR